MLKEGHAAGLMVIENALSAVCAPAPQLSVARTVRLNVPAAVGMPDMRPPELMFIPDGKEPAITLKVTGACPPEVATWNECTCSLFLSAGDIMDRSLPARKRPFIIRQQRYNNARTVKEIATDVGVLRTPVTKFKIGRLQTKLNNRRQPAG
jgi:hypothetical protein